MCNPYLHLFVLVNHIAYLGFWEWLIDFFMLLNEKKLFISEL